MGSSEAIYQILVDRFGDGCSGRPSVDKDQQFGLGDFYGGNLGDVISKLRDGWFSKLGITKILLSPLFEQISGWVPGAQGSFRHYAYHGYYVKDFTVIDPRFGTDSQLEELVSAAHAQGIGVMLDVVMNNPGYPDPVTFRELGISGWASGWEAATPVNFYDFQTNISGAFEGWWGPEWVRLDFPGYQPGGEDDQTMLLHGLPDFKTESFDYVSLPEFLQEKSNTRASSMPGMTVRGYLIKWLSDWVRRYGIDGFRCDAVKHVEPEAWKDLKSACIKAKEDWFNLHCLERGASPNFWMLGEVHGFRPKGSIFYDFGFDSLLNFSFQDDLANGLPLDRIYEDYAANLLNRSSNSFTSYISSHDTYLFPRSELGIGAIALMLSPGDVLIFYGDETGRPPGNAVDADIAQATRSPMNWSAVDEHVLSMWRVLSSFRARHPAIGSGIHLKLRDEPYAFVRLLEDGDCVLVVIDLAEDLLLEVSEVFADGQRLKDANSRWIGEVFSGRILIEARGLVLIEPIADLFEQTSELAVGGH